MSRREWMRLLCGSDLQTGRPFSVSWKGSTWDIATNKFGLLALRDGTWPEYSLAPDVRTHLDLMGLLVGFPQLELKRVWDWIERKPYARLQDLGHGSGLFSEREWEAPGTIQGVLVNRLLLASYLMPMPVESQRVTVAATGHGEPVYLWDADQEIRWVVLVMPLSLSTGPRAVIPELQQDDVAPSDVAPPELLEDAK